MATRITRDFTLEELIYSSTAKLKDIDNTPNNQVICNLVSLVNNVLQPLRTWYGKPIR